MSTVKIDFRGAIKASDNNVIAALKQAFASAYVLTGLAKQAHWAVEGAIFLELHHAFDAVYESADNAVDDLAERVRQLGDYVQVDLAALQKQSGIEVPAAPQDSKTWVTAVLAGLTKVDADLKALEQVSDDVDMATQDLALQYDRDFAKHSWFLRSTLK